jgi:hypothetical protein
MDKKLMTSICNQVYARFPEVKGTPPKLQPFGESSQLLVFKGQVTAADGKSISRIVRVVITQDGKISKITTSR